MSKLLIVDDDIRLRKLVRTYGEVEHYECDEAADGLAALEKLQDNNFDLVILDVMMPGLDGFETLERIRKTSEIPVIMLTARNEEYDKLTGFGLGVDDYVSKPFSPKELMARVGAVLKRNGRKCLFSPINTKSLRSTRIPAPPPSPGGSWFLPRRNLTFSWSLRKIPELS